MFVKHYAPNHMPDPKGEWSLKGNNSELHYGNIQKLISSSTPWSVTICQISGSKAVLQIFCSQGCSYTKCLCLKKGNKPTKNFRNRFKSLSVHLYLGLLLYAKYQNPSQIGSSDILFTRLFQYKIPVSEKGSNSTKNLRDRFKS